MVLSSSLILRCACYSRSRLLNIALTCTHRYRGVGLGGNALRCEHEKHLKVHNPRHC